MVFRLDICRLSSVSKPNAKWMIPDLSVRMLKHKEVTKINNKVIVIIFNRTWGGKWASASIFIYRSLPVENFPVPPYSLDSQQRPCSLQPPACTYNTTVEVNPSERGLQKFHSNIFLTPNIFNASQTMLFFSISISLGYSVVSSLLDLNTTGTCPAQCLSGA